MPSLPLLADFSLEMTGRDAPALADARGALPAGTRVNITFLGSEDHDTRIRAARAVVDVGLTPVAHIAARRLASEGELERLLADLQRIGASERVFVVGGDPATPAGPYASALEVIESGLLEAHGVAEAGIAGYPDGHPDIADDALRSALAEKLAAASARGLAPVVVTQFGFDADRVATWIRRTRADGVSAPIRVGVAGPTNVARLVRYARRFGIGQNAMIVRKYGFSLANLVGQAGPERFLDDLARALDHDGSARDIALHVYAFGGLADTARWAARHR
ncbi:methylenetetrahydrofolate reductase [Microbacterium sp. gxy059]|uniref:methylenetetrahydrofolate reductase n=1 Tax=Microbacterium sp. gxy059 TaxID=2957199 RepID=UPI003D97648D